MGFLLVAGFLVYCWLLCFDLIVRFVLSLGLFGIGAF